MEQVKIFFEGNFDLSEVFLVQEKFGPEVQQVAVDCRKLVRTYHEHTSSSSSSHSLSGVAVSKLH